MNGLRADHGKQSLLWPDSRIFAFGQWPVFVKTMMYRHTRALWLLWPRQYFAASASVGVYRPAFFEHVTENEACYPGAHLGQWQQLLPSWRAQGTAPLWRDESRRAGRYRDESRSAARPILPEQDGDGGEYCRHDNTHDATDHRFHQ